MLEIHHWRKSKVENRWSEEATSAAEQQVQRSVESGDYVNGLGRRRSSREKLRVTSAASLEDEKFRLKLKIHRRA
jgi:hypothetical protein